jgi:Tfp pilus assembly protein FimV
MGFNVKPLNPIYDNIVSLNIPNDAKVKLRCEGTADCFLMNEDEIETAISETNVVENTATLLATPGLNLTTAWHGNVLDALRDEGFLDDYERDGTFVEYLTEVLTDNFYDHDLINTSIEKYDHKRGTCTLTAELYTTIANLLEIKPRLLGWSAHINHNQAIIILEG